MRVLLIEHHQLLARPLKQGLEEEGFVVSLARTGEEGDCEATTQNYDVIILDPALPKEDGLVRLQRWRHNGLKTPVLVLTARAGDVERALAISLGADDYLTMPFELGQVFARLRALVPPGSLGPSVSVGDKSASVKLGWLSATPFCP